MADQTIADELKNKIAEMSQALGDVEVFRAFIAQRYPEEATKIANMQSYIRERGIMRQGRID
jgi:hypothetical protein